MREDFLHYLWKFKKFDVTDLKTSNGEEVVISSVGQYLKLAGPDFFNAQICIDEQMWAGNVEIHLKSSDWYVHHHETDPAYENVILHVVWEHDSSIFRKNNSEIPVLELRNYVSTEIVNSFQDLISQKSWIYCEKQISTVDGFIFEHWEERLFFERLERKSKNIEALLTEMKNDWESVLFCLLAKNFGLNTNGDLFLKVAQSIPFSIVRKEGYEMANLEALLFGKCGLLAVEKEDVYYKDLSSRFEYLSTKYKFEKTVYELVQFFKLRPDNFPTVRLSQLADLYHREQNLFSKLIACDSAESIYQVMNVSTSDYWRNHYQFDKESPAKKKLLTKSFIDLIIINTIIPLQFTFAMSQGKDIADNLVDLLLEVAPESNAIVQKFASFGIKSKNAFETQSLLQLKNEYCNHGRCLECAVGMELMKGVW